MKSGTERLADLAISESGFVFDPRSGEVFTVNASGRAILLWLKEERDPSAIVERIRREFQVGQDDVRRDLVEFMGTLRELGLLGREEEGE